MGSNRLIFGMLSYRILHPDHIMALNFSKAKVIISKESYDSYKTLGPKRLGFMKGFITKNIWEQTTTCDRSTRHVSNKDGLQGLDLVS